MTIRSLPTRKTTATRAFTLVEILAAMVFMGVLVPAIISALLLSNRAAVTAERATIAAQLADNKMGELMIDNAWSTAEKRGDFGADYPGYRWETSQTSWQTGNMTEFTLDVFYTVQGRERSSRFSTLVNTALSASPSPSPSASASP